MTGLPLSRFPYQGADPAKDAFFEGRLGEIELVGAISPRPPNDGWLVASFSGRFAAGGSLRLDADSGYVFESGWRDATLGVGTWIIASPVGYYWT